MRRWAPFGPNEQARRKSAVITTKRFVGRKLQPIDEIRIYNRPLTQTDIQSDMTHGV